MWVSCIVWCAAGGTDASEMKAAMGLFYSCGSPSRLRVTPLLYYYGFSSKIQGLPPYYLIYP